MSVTDEPVIWEICLQCQREFMYPHLCRTHMLCGMCHPDMARSDREADGEAMT